jgi:predicted nuclease of predicted toxin-antitoxin system
VNLLLFDQNLSPRLVETLADLYPEAQHVSTVGLGSAFDVEIWEYARQHNYVIVSKDVDFSELGLLHGFPPKVIWVRRGNCSTQTLAQLLRASYDSINALCDDPDTGILTLF